MKPKEDKRKEKPIPPPQPTRKDMRRILGRELVEAARKQKG